MKEIIGLALESIKLIAKAKLIETFKVFSEIVSHCNYVRQIQT